MSNIERRILNFEVFRRRGEIHSGVFVFIDRGSL
jgi:hypothetical protein